jgi:hypothetical protein
VCSICLPSALFNNIVTRLPYTLLINIIININFILIIILSHLMNRKREPLQHSPTSGPLAQPKALLNQEHWAWRPGLCSQVFTLLTSQDRQAVVSKHEQSEQTILVCLYRRDDFQFYLALFVVNSCCQLHTSLSPYYVI